MARWWSSTRKPSTSSGENDTAGTGTPEAEGGTAAAAASRLKKTLFRHRGKKDEAPATTAPNDRSKPFTQQNLEHQKILSNFAFPKTNRRKSSAQSYASGVSPGTSRTTSVDDAGAPADRRSLSGRIRRSLAADAAPREIPGGASNKANTPTAVLPGGASDAPRRA